jgi:hypothetical protein
LLGNIPAGPAIKKMFSRRQIRIQHPLNHELYQYQLGIRFDPGAQAEAFEPKFTLPRIVFRGPARLAGALNVFQAPQLWFNPQLGVVGLGGVQAGYLRGAPLIDPVQIGEGGGG